MHFRLAKAGDAEKIAKVHFLCTKDLPGAYEFKLGLFYIQQYYQILIGEKGTIILCAENDNGDIIGFASGSLNYCSEHQIVLRKNKFLLGLSALPGVIKHLELTKSLFSKQKGEYSLNSEAHFMFWGWLPDDKTPGGAILLAQKWLTMVRMLGGKNIRCEVDALNVKVKEIHLLLGAKLVNEEDIPDRGHVYILDYP